MWQIWLICRWLIHLDSLTISETWLTPNIIHPQCTAELLQLSSSRWSNSLALLWPCHKKQEHMRNAGRKRPVISELEGGLVPEQGWPVSPLLRENTMATQCFSTQTGWRGSLYSRREWEKQPMSGRCMLEVSWTPVSSSLTMQPNFSLITHHISYVCLQKKVYQVLF